MFYECLFRIFTEGPLSLLPFIQYCTQNARAMLHFNFIVNLTIKRCRCFLKTCTKFPENVMKEEM
jgi:hypothetical protein